MTSSALLAGCSAYSLAEPATPPIAPFGPSRADVGTICVIRPSHLALAVTFIVHDDGQLVGATRGESYFCYLAQPGKHVVQTSTGDVFDTEGALDVLVQAGKRYWLHQDYESTLGSVHAELARIDEPRAREMLEECGCEYEVIADVPGDEKLPPAVPIARAQP